MMLKMIIINEGMVMTCFIMVGPASGNDWLIRPSMGAMAALVTMINKEIDKIAGFFVSIVCLTPYYCLAN